MVTGERVVPGSLSFLPCGYDLNAFQTVMDCMLFDVLSTTRSTLGCAVPKMLKIDGAKLCDAGSRHSVFSNETVGLHHVDHH